MGIAEKVYGYLKLEDVDKKVAAMMEEEANFISTIQHNIFGLPYLSFSVFFHQVASVFLRLARLVKNILLLLGTLLLALGVLFHDRTVARDLGFSAAGRVLLVALNLTSVVLDLVSIVVNSLSFYKMLEIKFNQKPEWNKKSPKEILEEKQTIFRDHVRDGFFQPIKIGASTPKMCFDEITADLGLW